MHSVPLIAFLKFGSGAAEPTQTKALNRNQNSQLLPFWGKTKVTSRELWPSRPILPLCCFIFQAFLGMPVKFGKIK